ncbi:hypothetical protein [Sporosarcina sp. Te-1]|uniref:hypothetical protein n=1 Tax=Sporosarcina sp. Te-1 TaxID=2818390 RepID=UPI001A9CFE75|nr:hypothetical protein [Sporosarcina sp. Te-1]QTD40659.1 hypothetical protein J3U78_18145 [Sporosarcina sp. Te-1]
MENQSVVKSMESIVQDHEKRILELEKNYGEVRKEITVIQTSQAKIENMLFTQNTEQKELIDKHQREQTALLDTLLQHTLGMKKDNNKQRKDILVALFGGGGILFLLIEALQKWIGG